ncbi:MAG TPA: DUF2207 domain-containing protein, partial [Candidatus Stackebrandtia faecavium]|nr:DUF2207 domain-containing protein [Candidatus Stackebrandtia faecavium]
MKRIFQHFALWQAVCVLLVMIVLGYPFAPMLVDATEDAPTEDTTITDYRAEFDVNENGDMEVTERLTVDFPDDYSHGIFRFFDRHDPNAPGLRRVPRHFTAQVDPGLSLDERLERVVLNLPYAEDEIADARAQDDQEALEQIADDWYPDYGQVTK